MVKTIIFRIWQTLGFAATGIVIESYIKQEPILSAVVLKWLVVGAIETFLLRKVFKLNSPQDDFYKNK